MCDTQGTAAGEASPRKRNHTSWLVAVLVGTLILAGAYWGVSQTELLALLQDPVELRQAVARLGLWAPVGFILLMTAAIVLSPIPSAPIAVAAGALCGTFGGTLYVIIGAETGALIAFSIARFVGLRVVRKLTWARQLLGRARSQNALMAIVFASRLMPFLSFDAISYAAGLTGLTFWRFAAATLAGVIPISFLLAYIGDELVFSAASGKVVIIVLLLGGVTAIPLGASLMWKWHWKRSQAAVGEGGERSIKQ